MDMINPNLMNKPKPQPMMMMGGRGKQERKFEDDFARGMDPFMYEEYLKSLKE